MAPLAPRPRTHDWDGEPPSERAQLLIRQATARLISTPEELFTTVDEAVLATQPNAILADSELTDAIRASNRSNLAHWAAANLAHPGLRVPINRAAETLGLAKLIAQRGIDDTSRVSYGAGQNAAWTGWMRAVFSVTDDAGELQEVLDLSARSVFDFVERMLSVLREEIEREQGEVLSSANARRLALINRVLAGEMLGGVGQELRYPIDLFEQTAVVLSLPKGSARLLTLVEAVGPRLRRRPLSVVANADTVWAWFPSDVVGGPLDDELAQALRALAPERVQLEAGARLAIAVGPTRSGYDGFRGGHADALAAADVATTEVVTYNEVVLAALVRAEPARVRRFIDARVGPLDPEVRDTLRVYLEHRCSPSKAAAASYTHRNTVIDRIRRAEAGLRVPIEGHELELGLALELDRYF